VELNQNYLNGEGPCRECGICDSGGFTPNPGCFNPDAPIMFVGHTPGEKQYGAKKMRRDRLRRPDRNRRPPSSTTYEERWLNDDWGSGHTTLKKWLFGIDAENTEPTLTHPRESIYFTNLVKCSLISEKENELNGISAEGAKQRNESAYNNCPKYLEQELKKVDPQVILIAGKPAWKKFNSYFDAGLPTTKEFYKIIGEEEPKSYKFEFNKEYSLVPIYHWYHNNFTHLNWSEDKADIYYSKIAKFLNSLVDENVIQK